MELAKWDRFWNYFDKQWTPIIDKWNICNIDGDTINLLRHRGVYYARKLDNICNGQEAMPTYQDLTVVDIPDE
eukprot:10341726-Ditylum_brightwellii.AAC.1